MIGPSKQGYRPRSLTNRENYGLNRQQLRDYLEARGRQVPAELKHGCLCECPLCADEWVRDLFRAASIELCLEDAPRRRFEGF